MDTVREKPIVEKRWRHGVRVERLLDFTYDTLGAVRRCIESNKVIDVPSWLF